MWHAIFFNVLRERLFQSAVEQLDERIISSSYFLCAVLLFAFLYKVEN